MDENPSASAGSGEDLAVLLVEDSEDDAFLLQRQIRSRYPAARFERVECAEDMRLALSAQTWHVVVSDHQMPAFDSLAALQVLKASGQDIPFIICSGDLLERDGIHAMEDGAQDFVYKSSPGRLLPAIERELAHWQVRREKALVERSFEYLACYDELTGLPNRNRFLDEVTARLAERARTDQAVICYVDLDHFKRINETFGYAAGDALIHQVGERLGRSVSETSLVARVGRDEFALYVELQPDENENTLGERLMQDFAAPFTQGGQELYLTPSVGLAVWPTHGNDARTLVRSAESAMFDAKQNGRKTFQVYRSDINVSTRRRLALETDLRHAIERNELRVVYQPVINVTHERMLGTEALIRWQHPDLGLISPQDFIPIADETGLILPIGEWVLREACLQTRAWHARGFPDLTVAVNVSAAQFRDHAIADRIENILRETRLPPRALEIEITETLAMHDADSAGRIMLQLKDLGVRLAIDDFGTGYSSLAYLKRFPIDVLKIDQSFVRDVTDDEDDAAIVRAIVALARSLNIAAHAEGIETLEQATFMVNEGCDRLQGYLYGRPMAGAQLLATLIGDTSAGATQSIWSPSV